FHPRISLRNFARRGDFSYGLYLYGFAVQQLLVRHVPAAHHPLVLSAAALLGSFLLAALSWHVVERPFLMLKKRHAASPARHGAPAIAHFETVKPNEFALTGA